MRLFSLLVLRSFRTRPLRAILSTFGIVLGVAAILAIGVTNRNAMASIERLFENTSGKANLIVTSAETDGEGFSENLLTHIRSLSGVAAAVPSLQVQTALAADAAPTELGLSMFGQSAGGLVLYGIDPQQDSQVREYRMLAGEFLSDDPQAEEIVLVDTYASKNELELGKMVEVITPSGVEKLRLVGLMAKEGPGQLNNGAFGVIALSAAQKLSYRDGTIDQVDVVVTEDNVSAEGVEAMRSDLQTELGSAYAVIYPASQGRRMTQMLSNFQIGLNFLSGMALFVGAFLIYNAFTMAVAERTREFGMLRTVGMTREQVTLQVIAEALLLGMIGSGLGIGLGLLMARGLSALMGVMLAQEMSGSQVPPGVVATGSVVGILVTVLAALVPAIQAGRISPMEALLVRGRSKDGWLIRKGWVPGAIMIGVSAFILVLNPFPYDVQFRMGSMVVFGLFLGATLLLPGSIHIWEQSLRPAMEFLYRQSGRLGSRNVIRAKLRTTLTMAALMIGVAMVVIVWAMTGSFKGDLDEWLASYTGGDLYVSSSIPMGSEVWKRLRAVEGVQAVAPVSFVNVTWVTPAGEKEDLVFMGLDPASYTRVTRFQFSQTAPDPQVSIERLSAGSAVFISSVLAEKYGLAPGGQVIIQTKTGERAFEIAGVVVSYYNQGLVITGNWGDMERYFRQKDANAYMVKVQPGYTPDQVGVTIDALYGKRDRLTIESSQSLLERITVLMKQAFSMFDVLALIAILVGFFGIANTLTMNVIERTQEIGMLRSVGMTRFQTVLMVLAEAALIGLVGGILGIVLGVILARIFLAAMMAMSGYRLAFSLPVLRLVWAALAALCVSQVAALFPAMRAARTRILEAIHYE